MFQVCSTYMGLKQWLMLCLHSTLSASVVAAYIYFIFSSEWVDLVCRIMWCGNKTAALYCRLLWCLPLWIPPCHCTPQPWLLSRWVSCHWETVERWVEFWDMMRHKQHRYDKMFQFMQIIMHRHKYETRNIFNRDILYWHSEVKSLFC